MTHKRVTLYVTAILCLLSCTNGLKVQIFKDVKFKGLIYDLTTNDPECHTVKTYAQGLAGSLKTDTCLMIYEGLDCSGDSFKISRDMTDKLESLRRNIYSFQPCNEEYGGKNIHVKMFDDKGATIADYGNICSCQDLPSQVTTKLKSLNNHGNCIRVYPTDTCGGTQYDEIEAGRNGMSQSLPDLGYYVRSVSGCGNRRGCIKLSASIFKMVILEDKSRASESNEQEIDLAAKTTFYNNGSGTVFQEYEASRKIRESSTLEISKSITSMERHTVENGTTKSWGVEVSIPKIFNAAVNVANGIEKGYTTEKTETETETNTYTHEEENEFIVRQIIEIPPCAQYEVSSIVQMTENLPMLYEIYSKITGESSGKKMTADEVAVSVDDMTFVENLDEYTAVFKSTHSAVASVGVEATISGEGKPIPGCQQ